MEDRYIVRPISNEQSDGRYIIRPISEQPIQQASTGSYSPEEFGMGGIYKARELPESDIGPLRHVVRTGARLAEGAVGTVGGLSKLGLSAVDYAAKKLGADTNLAGIIPEALSSSEGFRETITKPMFGKAQEAEGETERFLDDWAELTGSLAVPIPGLGGVKLARAAGIGAAGAGAGTLARNFAPEGWEGPIKLGGVIGASLLAHKFAGKFPKDIMKSAYKNAEESLQEPGIISSLRTDSPKAKEFIAEMDTLAKRGRLGSSKGVYKQFRDAAFKDGRMDIAEVQNLKRELNDLFGDNFGKKQTIKELKAGIDKAKSVLKEYGETYNPTYLKELTKADEMYGAFAGAKRMRDMFPSGVQKFLKGGSNELLGAFLGKTLGFGTLKGVALGAAAGGIDATQAAVQSALRSPEVRKAYGQLLSSVLKDNRALAIKHLNNLNNALNKQGD
jgi:hypothetical protein